MPHIVAYLRHDNAQQQQLGWKGKVPSRSRFQISLEVV